MAGKIGQVITPVFEPLGFGNARSSVALIFGVVAKEVVVGTLGTLYGVSNVENEEGALTLTSALQADFTPLAAYSFMVFILLYTPCMAVLATIKRETNSWKWPIFTVFYTTAVAWIVAFMVYQGGTLLGLS